MFVETFLKTLGQATDASLQVVLHARKVKALKPTGINLFGKVHACGCEPGLASRLAEFNVNRPEGSDCGPFREIPEKFLWLAELGKLAREISDLFDENGQSRFEWLESEQLRQWVAAWRVRDAKMSSLLQAVSLPEAGHPARWAAAQAEGARSGLIRPPGVLAGWMQAGRHSVICSQVV